MAYVPVPKDLSKVKTKVALNLTKRQIICFAAALILGLPLFFLLKDSAGTSLASMVLATGNFTNSTFLVALKGMWFEYIIIFLCAFFISSHVAKYFAFRVVKPGDRPIAIIFAIQIFTVVCQVALASILGVWHGYGFTSQFIQNYLVTYCKNFIMAMPVQLFTAGPVARWIFRLIFKRGETKE